jgi:flavonol synthase
MTHPVPVIDLVAATAPSASGELLDTVKEATEAVGVIQVVNHGVPERLINEFDRRIGRLLALPRGGKGELARPMGHLYTQSNMWLGDSPGLRDLTFRYIAMGQSVAERVLGLYARAQGLPAGTFPISPLPYLGFTVNNYPVWTYPDTGNDEDKLLLLEHADGSAVTVLTQGGDHQGLQVQLPDGDWLPVPIVPGALQIFSGTLLTRWTNGRLRPARHRMTAGRTAKRRSVAIFYYQGLEQVLEPLAPFVGGPLRGPLEPSEGTAMEHQRQRVIAMLDRVQA